MQQIVRALIEERGMPPDKAYAIGRAALRRFRRSKHPEVAAAANRAEAGEVARQAHATRTPQITGRWPTSWSSWLPTTT